MIVIGLLRFIGLLNAAIWFGAIASLLLVANPGITSDATEALLGPISYPYFSAAIAQVVEARSFTVFLVCGLVAMLHIGAEWLYFGKYPTRAWLALVFALFLGGLTQSYAIQPRLKSRLVAAHSPAVRPPDRQVALHSFRVWHGISTAWNLLLLTGLSIHLWRVANPPDQMRFVGTAGFPGKFRS